MSNEWFIVPFLNVWRNDIVHDPREPMMDWGVVEVIIGSPVGEKKKNSCEMKNPRGFLVLGEPKLFDPCFKME